MMSIATDDTLDAQIRLSAATAAAPFMYPKLSAMMVAQTSEPAKDDTQGVLNRLMSRFARLAPTEPQAPMIEGTPVPDGNK